MTKRAKAEALHARALALQAKGELGAAAELYEAAAVTDRRWDVPLYNLGLLYKQQRNWKLSLKYNQRATELEPTNQPAWWNLGIAATALGRWQVAREAWRGFGVKVPDGTGPVELPCGFGPIRLNPDGEAEVVWAHRLDPARAEIASIPFPESGHRWRDIVLNDGAPVGYRKYDGKDYPVLNAIELLQPSPFGTYVARVHMPENAEYVAKLAETAAQLEGSAEDWSTSIRIVCKACSEGRPHADHDTAAAPPDGVHLIGVAARDRQHALKMLNAWEADLDEVHVEALADALEAGT